MAGGFRVHRGRATVTPSTGRGNDGTGSKPGGAIDVTTTTFSAAFFGATAGTILYLAPGAYDAIDTFGFNKSGTVTIYGQTGVTFPYMFFDTCTDITVKYVTFIDVRGSAPQSSMGMISSTRIIEDHCTHTGSASPLNGVGGYTMSCGYNQRLCTDCTLTNSIIQFFNSGSAGQDNTRMIIRGNLITSYSNNGIFFKGEDGTTIDKNVITTLDHFQDDGNHPDGIQFSASENRNSSNLTVTNNYVRMGISDPTAYAAATVLDGIYFEATDTLNVSGNSVIDIGDNGIMISSSTNVTCNDNYTNGYLKGNCRIFIRGGSNISTFNRNKSPVVPFNYGFHAGVPPDADEQAATNDTYGAGADANTTVTAMTSIGDNTNLAIWQAAHPNCPTA